MDKKVLRRKMFITDFKFNNYDSLSTYNPDIFNAILAR